MHRFVLAPLALVAAAFFATSASADQAFHTLHAELTPIGSAPLQNGFVNDVHTNGVVNGAHEIYHLAGAAPNATYQVTIQLYPLDPTCSTAPLVFPTAQVTTNGVGNGDGHFTFPAGPPSPLAGSVSGIRWVLVGANGPAYETGCEPLTLD
jgi:hypothetical protein